MCMYIYIYVCVCIPSKQKYGPGNVPLFGRNLRPRCVAKITTDAMMMPTSQDVRIFNHSDWQKKQGESSGTEWNKKNMLKNIKNESYIVRDIECSCLPKQWAFLKEYICEEQLCLGLSGNLGENFENPWFIITSTYQMAKHFRQTRSKQTWKIQTARVEKNCLPRISLCHFQLVMPSDSKSNFIAHNRKRRIVSFSLIPHSSSSVSIRTLDPGTCICNHGHTSKCTFYIYIHHIYIYICVCEIRTYVIIWYHMHTHV